MCMLVLAGGFGTRIKNAIGDTPKPLALVKNTPFLYFQIENWLSQGVRSFVFLLHHRAIEIKEFVLSLKNSLLLGCKVQFLVEPTPLDTGGAVANAVRHFCIEKNFLVVNADTWVGNGIQNLFEIGAQSIALVMEKNTDRFGQVEIDDDNVVLAFHEKQQGEKPSLINAGMYNFTPVVFEKWRGHRLSLESDVLPSLVENQKLKGVKLDTSFIDIGVPEDYLRFCEWQNKA